MDDFCGFFALANAVTLCEGLDPEKLHFDQIEIRNHYCDIVYRGNQITPFPSRDVRVSSREIRQLFDYNTFPGAREQDFEFEKEDKNRQRKIRKKNRVL